MGWHGCPFLSSKELKENLLSIRETEEKLEVQVVQTVVAERVQWWGRPSSVGGCTKHWVMLPGADGNKTTGLGTE